VIVWAASLSPSLAERRMLRTARARSDPMQSRSDQSGDGAENA
jgi:hypothetical protein